MKRRPAKRIKKSKQVQAVELEEKQLLELLARLIVDIALKSNDNDGFDNSSECTNLINANEASFVKLSSIQILTENDQHLYSAIPSTVILSRFIGHLMLLSSPRPV